MIEASCHCGAVCFSVETPPKDVNSCNCSICRRYGTLWGYYLMPRVSFASDNGPTDVYTWGARSIEFHRCRDCGCVVWWLPVDKARDRMGINARLFPPDVLAAIPVRHSDNAS